MYVSFVHFLNSFYTQNKQILYINKGIDFDQILQKVSISISRALLRTFYIWKNPEKYALLFAQKF